MHCFSASTRNKFWREFRFQTQVAKITVDAVPRYTLTNQKWLILEKTQVMFWVHLPNGMEQRYHSNATFQMKFSNLILDLVAGVWDEVMGMV